MKSYILKLASGIIGCFFILSPSSSDARTDIWGDDLSLSAVTQAYGERVPIYCEQLALGSRAFGTSELTEIGAGFKRQPLQIALIEIQSSPGQSSLIRHSASAETAPGRKYAEPKRCEALKILLQNYKTTGIVRGSSVRNLWRQAEDGIVADEFIININGHACALLKLKLLE